MHKLISKIDNIRNGVQIIDKAKFDECFNLKNISLRSYQQDGIKWLIERYKSKCGCILADEMGLGKTCQTIGLVVHVLSNKKAQNRILILSPLSVVNNWSDELKRFAPSVKFIVYKGDKDDREDLQTQIRRDTSIEVIVTSYDLILIDDFLFETINWELLVVDEGHRLKNSNSLLYQCLDSFNITQRVLLTGTPIQNNLIELYALLTFVQPSVFKMKYKDRFVEKYSAILNDQELNDELTRIMQPFILRRMKSQVNLNLPDKLEVILYHGLTDLQKKLYKSILLKDRDAFVNPKQVRLVNLIIHLRKICSHPYLMRGVEPEPFELGEHLIETSDKFLLLDNLLSYLHKNNHKVLLFSQFTIVLDIVQDYLGYRGYNYERLDGSIRGEERTMAIDSFNKDKETFIFLLSTKAGGVGLNLVSADTCIFMDNDWNPMNDEQAAARCHRIGQQRPVMIVRLIARSSIEEIIHKRAEAKLKLSNEIMESGKLANTLDASAIQTADIVKYGLDELFSTNQKNDFKTVDFEALLAPTKNGHWQIKNKIEISEQNEDKESVTETAPKTLYEFEGKDYSKEIGASEKDQEKFDELLRSIEASSPATGATLVDDSRNKRKRETIHLYDEIVNVELDAATKLAKKQKLDEQKQRKAELLKKKWADRNYESKGLVFNEDDLQADNADFDETTDNDEVDTKFLHYVKGDVTVPTYAKNQNAIIVHCVDNSGRWGSGGLFDALSKRQHNIPDLYKDAFEMNDLHVDDVHFYEVTETNPRETNATDYVALVCAQKRDKHGNLSELSLKSIEICFNKIYLKAKQLNASVHMPRIGHRTRNFNWYGIEKLIKKCFVLRRTHAFIYYFERNRANRTKTPMKVEKEDGDDDDDVEFITASGNNDKRSTFNTHSDLTKLDKINECLPNIFSNINFYFYDGLNPKNLLVTIDLMKRYIIAYDGTIEEFDSDLVTHVITDKDSYEKLKEDLNLMKTFKNSNIISYEWLQNCILRKRLLNIEPYKF